MKEYSKKFICAVGYIIGRNDYFIPDLKNRPFFKVDYV
jgi:hypothetical protein